MATKKHTPDPVDDIAILADLLRQQAERLRATELRVEDLRTLRACATGVGVNLDMIEKIVCSRRRAA